MAVVTRRFESYSDVLRAAYEEEVSGEGYFAGLCEQHSGPARAALSLIVELERATAALLRPVVERHGLVVAETQQLLAAGREAARARMGQSWPSLVREMAEQYPAYMPEFDQLIALAPTEDAEVAKLAAEHELVLIAFAERELAGDPDSVEPIRQFLAAHGPPRRG